ncbi:hypothetical protein L198_05218 [Cryptococcus wingfieldii CBS 7118]|uniref:Uncharacterized protein n=1 Tax=Cryptococcus wingfieldii CBS 7118 TaxID=1295528 RepID=A0A1E3J0I2_9TREE|nr:hypothetical protein L198_05218 [Cryptococcus wingfieldii CBS 7118]ODN94359.1 hypothetical protein L198_05218 [Cryptococcus wingfieldii CBS 7118]
MSLGSFDDLVKNIRRGDDPPIKHIALAMRFYYTGNDLEETALDSYLKDALTPSAYGIAVPLGLSEARRTRSRGIRDKRRHRETGRKDPTPCYSRRNDSSCSPVWSSVLSNAAQSS